MSAGDGRAAASSPIGVTCQSGGRWPSACSSAIDIATYESESPPRLAKVSRSVASGRSSRSAKRATQVPVGPASGGRLTRRPQCCDRRVVGLARGQPRQLVDTDDADRLRRRAQLPHGARAHRGGIPLVLDRHHEPLVLAGAGRAEQLLRAIEVDPQPEHLHEAAAPADDLVQPVRAAPREVAGAQRFDLAPEREVGGRGRVAEHHVRARVDELADALPSRLDRRERERAAGDRHADRAGMRRRRGRAAGRPSAPSPPSARTSRTGPSRAPGRAPPSARPARAPAARRPASRSAGGGGPSRRSRRGRAARTCRARRRSSSHARAGTAPRSSGRRPTGRSARAPLRARGGC